MTVDQLLLTATRSAQLTAALANTGIPDPLAACLAEAEADVARFTAGYTIEEDAVTSFVRPLALRKAYALCGPVPSDIEKEHQSALEELRAIAEGKRLNLPRADTGQQKPSGAWGSDTQIPMRTDET